MSIVFAICFFIAMIIGVYLEKWYAEIERNDDELTDPTVHVLERKIYWLSNINLAFNKIKKIFDDNPDKFVCLKLECQEKSYHHNKFYCRYRSIGNKYIIKMNLSSADVPFFMIEENKLQ